MRVSLARMAIGRSLARCALVGWLLATAACGSSGRDAAAGTSESPTRGWSGSGREQRADHPQVVALDAQHVYAFIAPFRRQAERGESGLVAIDRDSGNTRWLLRFGTQRLPNPLAKVYLADGALFWLDGLTLMRSESGDGATRVLAREGSMQSDLHGDALFLAQVDGMRSRLQQVGIRDGAVRDLGQVDLRVEDLAADASALYLRSGQPSQLWRFDRHSRRLDRLYAPADPKVRIARMAARRDAAAAGRIDAIAFITFQPDGARSSLHRLDLDSGQVTDLDVAMVDGESPLVFAGGTLYGFVVSNRSPFDMAWSLFRLAAGATRADLVASGNTGTRHLVADAQGLYWSDLRAIYSQVPGTP